MFWCCRGARILEMEWVEAAKKAWAWALGSGLTSSGSAGGQAGCWLLAVEGEWETGV